MKYPNQHKMLINKVLEGKPQLEKWQARILANRIIAKIILSDKNLKNVIMNEINGSEFEDMVKLKELKTKIKTTQKVS